MATVLLVRYSGPFGFWRPAALKKLHEPLARNPAFVSMLLDEARLGAHVRHPLVTEVLDLVADEAGVCLVMQYVHGESLRTLLETGSAPVPVAVASAIVADALHGLHAAHEARGPDGTMLGIVHRDVSPHNLLVGLDGFTRVTDFGIAKAAWRAQSTVDGQLKGKLAYMAPEQLGRGSVDRRADVFGAAVVLWELLAGRRLFDSTDPDALAERGRSWKPPSIGRDDLPDGLEPVVLQGLAPARSKRFDSALQMAEALEHACRPAGRSEIASWVERMLPEGFAQRSALLARAQLADGSDPESLSASGAWKSSPDASTLPTVSQEHERTPSGLGPTAMDTRRPAARRPSTLLSVAGVSALVAAIATLSLDQCRSSNSAPSLAAGRVTEAPMIVSASARSPEPAAVPSSMPVPVASSAPAASAIAPKDPAPITAPRPVRAIAAPKPAVTSSPNCNPPYRTDESGVKVYKVECL